MVKRRRRLLALTLWLLARQRIGIGGLLEARFVALVLLVLAGVLANAPLLHVARAQTRPPGVFDKSIVVGVHGGSIAFPVTAAGTVKARVSSAGAPLKARLLGPKGEATSKPPPPGTTIELSTQATDADIATGKYWVLALSTADPIPKNGRGPTATIHIEVAATATKGTLPPTDAEIAKELDVMNRAAPRVTQVTPPMTPLVPDVASVMRIIAARIPNAHPIVANVGLGPHQTTNRVPSFIPRPAHAGRTFVPIVEVDVADDDSARSCGSNSCLVKWGDILTIALGPGPSLETLMREVHLVFFDPERDYALRILEWRDDLRKVVVQMPHLPATDFDKHGGLYVGKPEAAVVSTWWGFTYDPTIVSYLPLAGQKIVTSTSPPPANAEYNYSGIIDHATRFVTTRGAAVSFSGHDQFLAGVTLKNGWTVRKIEHLGWSSQAVVPHLEKAGHEIIEEHPGTSNASVGVDWWYPAAGTLYYTLAIKAQGREGTLPY